MSFTERSLTSAFCKFLRTNPKAQVLHFSFAIEFKLKHGKQALHLLRDFRPQQIPMLIKANNSCVYHKISDQTQSLKPFDSMQICYSPAFVGVMWHKPRQKKLLYLLDVKNIQEWLNNKCYKIGEADAAKSAIFTFEL